MNTEKNWYKIQATDKKTYSFSKMSEEDQRFYDSMLGETIYEKITNEKFINFLEDNITEMNLKLKQLNGADLPKKGTDLAGAYDLQARNIKAWMTSKNVAATPEKLKEVNFEFINYKKPIRLLKGERIIIGTDQQVADCPTNIVADVKSRSGLSFKHGVFVINGDGLVDADYRQEIGVILTNVSCEAFEIRFNDKIAQLEVRAVEQTGIESSDEIIEANSDRNGGFGSTDKSYPEIVVKTYGRFFPFVKDSVDEEGWTYVKEVDHLLDVSFENNTGNAIEYQKSFGPSGDNPHWKTRGARWRPKILSDYFVSINNL